MTLVQRAEGSGSGVRLSEIVAAISLAGDIGLGQPMEHVLRACVIAVGLGRHLGVSDEDLDTVYWTTLLMTVGCTGSSYEITQVWGDDIALRTGFYDVAGSQLDQLRYFLSKAGSDRSPLGRLAVRADLLRTQLRAVEESFVMHCKVSGHLGDRLGLPADVSRALAQTFTRWDGKGLPRGVGGEDTLLPLRIAQLADTVEVRHRAAGVDGTVELVRQGSGTRFDPRLVSVWSSVAGEVLGSLDGESSWGTAIAAEPLGRKALSDDELDRALEAVADYADLKSPWFSGHSRGVAELAVAAARHAGVAEKDVTTLRRAALLHDLGRNGVPNTVWDKPGPLAEAEVERARLHAYLTDRVVRRAGALAPLAAVASAAHERAEGSGYPRGIAGDTIPALGRLLEAADAYHAMLEARPHRPALSKSDAARELRAMATAGTLRGDAVDAVLAAAGHARRRKASAPAGLSPRELEVLTLVARGKTVKAVAAELGLSPKTVGNHVERGYAKIGVSTRAEATMFAMQHGLLETL
jgi:HD-GYP domain-containing protein (c-di-GMP phosphodiesterase class II)